MKRRLFSCFLAAAGVAALAGCARIKPDEIGVRTRNVGPAEGIVPEDYEPGYHRFLWPLDTWNRFPSTAQRLRFAKDNQGAWTAENAALQLTSADGDHVGMNAEVFFRIAEGQAHHVLQDSGAGERYKDVVRGLAQDAARLLFGQLRTESFYDEAKREAARGEAVKMMRERLKPRGIELIDFLVESVEFDPNYENLIRQKKLADQRVELEKAKSRAAEQRAKVTRIAADTTIRLQKIENETAIEIGSKTLDMSLKINGLKAEAEKYASGVNADAALYKTEKETEGQRLVKGAEAEGSKRLNEALIGEGGRNLVALEAVKKLNLGEITFPSPGYEWFNPHEMALQLGAAADAGASTNAVGKK